MSKYSNKIYYKNIINIMNELIKDFYDDHASFLNKEEVKLLSFKSFINTPNNKTNLYAVNKFINKLSLKDIIYDLYKKNYNDYVLVKDIKKSDFNKKLLELVSFIEKEDIISNPVQDHFYVNNGIQKLYEHFILDKIPQGYLLSIELENLPLQNFDSPIKDIKELLTKKNIACTNFKKALSYQILLPTYYDQQYKKDYFLLLEKLFKLANLYIYNHSYSIHAYQFDYKLFE